MYKGQPAGNGTGFFPARIPPRPVWCAAVIGGPGCPIINKGDDAYEVNGVQERLDKI